MSVDPAAGILPSAYSVRLTYDFRLSGAAGAGKVLRPGGLLLVYGPFKVDGKCTTESNASFDMSLRQQNPEWGYRCFPHTESWYKHTQCC